MSVKLLSCKCSLCGEALTCPIEYNGSIYGYSCIKKVNPSFRKPSIKEYWVNADSFECKQLENSLQIKAYYKGSHYKQSCFVDFHHSIINFKKNILLQDGKAFINLYAFKTGKLFI